MSKRLNPCRICGPDCARIVAASIDPDRVLGGIDGHDGGEPDMLLTTVERIVAERTRALREANVEEVTA